MPPASVARGCESTISGGDGELATWKVPSWRDMAGGWKIQMLERLWAARAQIAVTCESPTAC